MLDPLVTLNERWPLDEGASVSADVPHGVIAVAPPVHPTWRAGATRDPGRAAVNSIAVRAKMLSDTPRAAGADFGFCRVFVTRDDISCSRSRNAGSRNGTGTVP